jgi:flagellar basal body-associated protein FliL
MNAPQPKSVGVIIIIIIIIIIIVPSGGFTPL